MSIGRPIRVCVLAFAGLFALEGLIFHTALYRRFLEPDSSTGEFELILRRERHAQNDNGDNLVVTLGDSRFAYAPRLSNEITAKTGYVFRHAGVAGTTARSWYYMLRDLDPTAQRYRAIVLGVSNFNDVDEYYNPYDDIRELHYLIARLRVSDAWEFPRSFQRRDLQWQAFRGILLKATILQTDILAFLSHPLARLATVDKNRRGYDSWTYTFEETERDMTGLQVDWRAGKFILPPGAGSEERDTMGAEMLMGAPQTGRLAAFRRQWLGRILDRYRGSRTRIVFIRLPRGPIPCPDELKPKAESVIREFAKRPGVLLAEEHTFDSLERVELFKDGIHLNRAGIARFSPMLAEEISRILNGGLRSAVPSE
jgi:hypothetical protein